MDRFTLKQLMGVSLILVGLGIILWVHMRRMRYGNFLTFPDTEVTAYPRFKVKASQGARRVGPSRDRKSA